MLWLEKFIDATARRPSGKLGRSFYRESKEHRRGFELLKDKLKLQSTEKVLEVGCGGGVLLQELLETAVSAAAIDHSEDMIELTAQRNAAAIESERLDLRLGDVNTLPWSDESFDAVVSANMFFFIEDPVCMLREILRVLKPGGRLVIVTSARSMLGQLLFLPYAHAMHCYSDEKMSDLLSQAGFNEVQVSTKKFLLQVAWGRKHD